MPKKTITRSEVDNTMLTVAQETQPTKKTITYKEVKKVALDVWNGGVQPTPPTPVPFITHTYYEDFNSATSATNSARTMDFVYNEGDTLDAVSYDESNKEFTILNNTNLKASYRLQQCRSTSNSAKISIFVNDNVVKETTNTNASTETHVIDTIDFSSYPIGSKIQFKSLADRGVPVVAVTFIQTSVDYEHINNVVSVHTW